MLKLKESQKEYIRVRALKIGELYMFPRWGFTIYDANKNADYLSTNPFTKSLDKQFFYLKEIGEDGLVRGNFYERPLKQDFYLNAEELKKRDHVEMFFMSLFYVPYCWIKNTVLTLRKKDS